MSGDPAAAAAAAGQPTTTAERPAAAAAASPAEDGSGTYQGSDGAVELASASVTWPPPPEAGAPTATATERTGDDEEDDEEAEAHASPVEIMEARMYIAFSKTDYARVIDTFRKFDVDSSGIIDQNEFREAVASFGIEAPREVCDAAFHSIDADGSGGVDYRELYSVLKQRDHSAAAIKAAEAAAAAQAAGR